jgi:hypothetical protein
MNMHKAERSEFQNLPDCLRLTNGTIDVVVTTSVGPRVLFYGFTGGENVFAAHPDAKTATALGEFKPYGGHRLWIAPENMPNSYAPDNAPVEYAFDEARNSIRLIQPLENITQTQKEITLTLAAAGGSGVIVHHKITNRSARHLEIAAWALTIMNGGDAKKSGEAIIPNEPFAAYGANTLLPVRNLTLWSYTNLSDSRFSFDEDSIRLKVDAKKTDAQKIGVFNRQGWAAYRLNDVLFKKRFDVDERAKYPDMNSNTELYTAGDFIELETLSPLKRLAPEDSIEHIEQWTVEREG